MQADNVFYMYKASENTRYIISDQFSWEGVVIEKYSYQLQRKRADL